MSAEPVTEDELAEVERLDRDATPGTWSYLYIDDAECIRIARRDGEQADTMGMTQEDHRLACRARTLLPKLAASERANRRSLDEANAALRRISAEADVLRQLLQNEKIAREALREAARNAIHLPYGERLAALLNEVERT